MSNEAMQNAPMQSSVTVYGIMDACLAGVHKFSEYRSNQSDPESIWSKPRIVKSIGIQRHRRFRWRYFRFFYC